MLSSWLRKCNISPAVRSGRHLPWLNIEQLECRDVPASVGTGTGLVANYFNDLTLTNLAATRTDATVNFNWGLAAPLPTLPIDGYSVRWSGQVQAQATEAYTFTVTADEGIRLWVGGQKLIDTWGSNGGEWSTTLPLTAGETYDVKLEYADRAGQSNVRITWASPSTPRQDIPSTQLYGARGWLNQDLGTATTAGSLRSVADQYIVRGAGPLGAQTDQGHFAYQSINGDGEVVARLDSLTGLTPRAGIMIRAGTAVGDAYAALTVVSGQVIFQSRTATGVASTQTTAIAAGAQPWLKLIRNGSLVSGYISDTGVEGTWKYVGTAKVNLDTSALGGLVAGSAFGVNLSTATFSNVSVKASVPVGANITDVRDWSLANAFVDVMKQARTFTAITQNRPARTDANGWPTEDFYTIFQSGFLNTARIYNGVYKLSFTGRANLSLWATPGSISNVQYNAATNRTTADLILSANDSDSGWYFGLNFTNVGSGIKDIQLIRPGYDPSTTQIFTNEFLNTIRSFSTIRTMDFTETNNNAVVNWSDRAKATDATQSSDKGVAWEYVIALANQTGKDIWINVPYGATDDYVRQLATLLKSSLNPDRAVYVEFSNELWNGGFSQTQANLAAAVAEVTAGMASGTPSNLFYPGETTKTASGAWASQWDWAFRRIARRITEISNTFSSVWGADAINARVRPVLATQSAVPYIGRTQLEFIDKIYGDPKRFLYGLAGAPYFAVGDIDQQTNLTVDQILSSLSTAVDANSKVLTEYSAIASYYGLKNLAYEGGPDTFGPNNIAAKKAASLDPRMQALTARYLSDWYTRGGLFMWYMAGPTNYDTRYGTWGLTNDITNLNTPKVLGVEQVRQAPKVATTAGTPVAGEVLANNSVGAAPTTEPYPRYLKSGDVRDYMIRVPQTGTYELRIRYAQVTPGGQIQVLVNDQNFGTYTLPVTGPNYDSKWAPNDFALSVPISLRLTEGVNVVRLNVVVPGYTLQSLQFNGVQTAVPPVSPPPVSPPPVSPPPVSPPPVVNQAPVVLATGLNIPVTGTTASLSAVGSDDGGESALKYAWTLVSGPANVAFSATGTNAAKATTATFSQSGNYVIRVTATDAGGLTGIYDLSVLVSQTYQSLTINPTTAAMVVNSVQAYVAVGIDQFGNSMTAIPVAWTLSGVGTLSSNGVYTAPSTAGTATVTATSNGKTATSSVSVIPLASSGLTLAGLKFNGTATMNGSRLGLTNDRYQAGSGFTQTRVGIKQFDTTFRFQLTPSGGYATGLGTGFTFAVQGKSSSALGNWDKGMGFTNIRPGVAVRFDIVKGEIAIDSEGQIINRMALLPSILDLKSENVFEARVSYVGNTLTVTLTDTVTGKSATFATPVNITQEVGGNTGFVGFTGGTGATAGFLDILGWNYSGQA